jgi:hypothetical protein
MKPFTAISALLLFAVAIAQAARAYMGVDVVIGDFHVLPELDVVCRSAALSDRPA